MRNVYLLLAAWCVLAIAPAVAVQAGLFGELHVRWHGARIDNDSIPTGAVVVWIAGFVVQFLVFMLAMRAARRTSIAAFFVASCVPFVSDWAPLAGSPWFAAPSMLLTVGTAIALARAAVRSETLARDGVDAKGVVLEVIEPTMNVVVNRVYIKRKLRLRIVRDDGVAPYEAVFDGTFMIGQIPAVGAELRLRVDRANPQHFEAVGAISKPPGASGSVAEELERLVRLRDQGAMTEAEFTAAKRKVIGEP